MQRSGNNEATASGLPRNDDIPGKISTKYLRKKPTSIRQLLAENLRNDIELVIKTTSN